MTHAVVTRKPAGAGPLPVPHLAAVVRAAVEPLPARRGRLSESLGATLAEPIVAATALPRADTAAMDGYAVNGPGPTWSLCAEVRVAGAPGRHRLGRDCAVRIATGATTPSGTTAVLREEHVVTHAGGESIALAPGARWRDDTRRSGEHWAPGETLVPAGSRVTAAVISIAASAETPRTALRGPVSADVAITGDEIRTAGPLDPGQTRDSLTPALPEFLRSCEIGCRSRTHLRDDPELLYSWCRTATTAPLLIVVGGTGRGAADHLHAVTARLDGRIVLDGVAMRPGGSQLLAVLPDGRLVLGLPGNPFAAVAALLTTGPVLVDALTARPPRRRPTGRIIGELAADPGRARLVPVRRLDGGGWQSLGSPQTPHLRDLVDAQALALVGPAGLGTHRAELVPLPQ